MVCGPTGDGGMAGEGSSNGNEDWNSESSTDDDEPIPDDSQNDIRTSSRIFPSYLPPIVTSYLPAVISESTGTVGSTGPVGAPWEPMAKSYVNMNLKESVLRRDDRPLPAPPNISLDDPKDDDDDDDDDGNLYILH